ncbi:hypothetical protein F3Y22_tig00110597pilonHSYRG00224 [Hibiscus syriacus]|uniref:Uncharacterized protein n=1 Tax=Hibiscus syriacus TaxID=106335 RepID=A0A6A3A5Q0_HIBSY|nr:hypothetical protein F3Y22_tig00110597pilonHSYRG00224 [Hibiscus syriacus]
MATPQPQEKPETWPLRDDEYTQDSEDAYPSSGCGCIGGLCGWRRNSNGYMVQAQAEEVRSESWLKRKAKKLKEISEVLAGPRWKNFIRRFSPYGINKKRRSQFHYDPQSYQLNFDHRKPVPDSPISPLDLLHRRRATSRTWDVMDNLV